MRDDTSAGKSKRNGFFAGIQALCISSLAAATRALPFERGKVRLTWWIPLNRLARDGHFAGRVFRGTRGIRWDASTLPDIMTRSMFWTGSYQNDVLGCFSLALRPGDVVFDIGAHYGLMTIFASKLVGERGKVVSFEPSPRNRQVLLRHCDLNHCANVQVEALGLLDKPGEFEFYMTEGNSWNSTFDASFAANQAYAETTVRADTLDGYIERTGLRPSLLKIDTEGTEQECLIGGEKSLRKLRPVIAIEYNSLSQARPGLERTRVLHQLRDLGYRMFLPTMSFWQRNVQRFDELDLGANLKDALVNVLCVPASRDDLLRKIGAP